MFSPDLRPETRAALERLRHRLDAAQTGSYTGRMSPFLAARMAALRAAVAAELKEPDAAEDRRRAG
ncbi:hypothetical protein N1F89_12435 [Aquibium sp. A9E412]|uniref:hypothetical protein n=1 Tax=Aquibium sp. A9E412 TaxID=2976767 RepID=UPI0025B0F846|nr:hypothetical protein [Aquibium sp. A9E412]MDN2567029.1 hypothetical protein [Aquibium sp. A9E412]